VVEVIKKVLVSILFFQLISTNAIAQTNQNQQIQIFDLNKGKVIKVVPMKTDLQQEAEKFLEGITGVYVKYNPIPKKGYVIRMPLEPTIRVENQWLEDLVDEVSILYSDQEKPYIMVFDEENKTYFFTFEGNTDHLLRLLKFNPQVKHEYSK
jgi:hypothetical protein